MLGIPPLPPRWGTHLVVNVPVSHLVLSGSSSMVIRRQCITLYKHLVAGLLVLLLVVDEASRQAWLEVPVQTGDPGTGTICSIAFPFFLFSSLCVMYYKVSCLTAASLWTC